MPTDDEKERLKLALALTYCEPSKAEEHCTAYGVDLEHVLSTLAEPEGLRAAIVAAQALRQSGQLLKRQALAPLEKLVAHIDEMIDAGHIPPGTAPKLADTLLKLTGLAEERASRLRLTEPEKPSATVFVLHGDEKAPPTRAGESRITIRLPATPRPQGDIIDAEPAGGSDEPE
ncbi:hypothetical protein [Denitromonas halophila]|uniref:Uncharacterized protein n=1 Tax=Denitromonas halophila TaxID=1629404 RepID=A0A557QJJ0_9RHOO|nr:hypothetical protein [Denitromonas halophila]TVO53076.1 hypothetical protein FHP91_14825 [Denitromonas halophila]